MGDTGKWTSCSLGPALPLIRCIKPNEQQQRGHFSFELVKCPGSVPGLLENVRATGRLRLPPGLRVLPGKVPIAEPEHLAALEWWRPVRFSGRLGAEGKKGKELVGRETLSSAMGITEFGNGYWGT